MNFIINDILMHYGVGKMDGAPGRGSGRYELGSGANPNQHGGDLLTRIDKLKKEGLSEKEIADALEVSISELRNQKAIAKNERRASIVASIETLKEKGYNDSEIARQLNLPGESSVRSYLNEKSKARMNAAKNTADFLKEQIEEKGMLDVGIGLDKQLNVTQTQLDQALTILENDGYKIYSGRINQVTNPNSAQKTTVKVLCPPGTEYSEIYTAFQNGDVHSVTDYISYDNGQTFKPAFVYPKSMDSSRLDICYKEDGGDKKDGLIEIRRGVQDLSLGDAVYAQVRILVDDSRYIKGMAVYSDDLPPGIDVRFNTNKSNTVSKLDALKKITDDPDNPFGSSIKEHGGQSYYTDENGEQQLSLINKRADEGDWEKWKDKLPAQFLSKQSMKLINSQLDLAKNDAQAEFDEICELTNPTVKKALLNNFASSCDSAAVHLYAAALPRQSYQVILPLTTIKDTEVYAPNYNNGDTVALVRFPHAGTFEIPILTVNNKNKEGREMLGTTPADAVGINSNVAARLSGADFDGDTVMVIPCNSDSSNIKITSTPALDGLKDFDPKSAYPGYEGMKTMKNTQNEMGRISNLITDMTLIGATNEEMERAVRHSMVVIDAEKHGLDYKQSEIDNNIAALKKKYQAHENDDKYGGSATLISRAKSEVSVTKRRGSPSIDPETGEQVWKTVADPYYTVAVVSKRSKEEPNATVRVSEKSGRRYAQFDGEEAWVPISGKSELEAGTRVVATAEQKERAQASTRMAETNDAMTLVSTAKTPQEIAYANYANSMKSLANQARLEILNSGKLEYSPSAKATYQKEVDSLMIKLNNALKNTYPERQAQLIANSKVTAKKQDNPNMSNDDIKKASQQALKAARNSVGAKRQSIEITDKEWEAIQAGAITENKLTQILKYTDIDDVREKAMPKQSNELTNTEISRIKLLIAAGYTTEQIAQRLGHSTSTIRKYAS